MLIISLKRCFLDCRPPRFPADVPLRTLPTCPIMPRTGRWVGRPCDALLREAHAEAGRGAGVDGWGGGDARRCPVRVVAVGRSGRAASPEARCHAGRGAGDGGGGRGADGMGAGRPLPGGAARVGAGIWARAAVPGVAWPVSAQPQSDVCRGGCCLAWMGAVLPSAACLGGAGHRVRCLRGDRAVGGAAAPGPLRQRLPGLLGGGSSLGAADREPREGHAGDAQGPGQPPGPVV
jgi:hypothetical protein